ncbi:MAG TPA: NAD(P)/FAD-dependent oxidoreductase, partial [Candidatus Omnitrophota bacterium]|nr:NAD(P)/FAD-dependent oxidoreductase [Candidatus Omnitrophota bacterium]
MNYDYDLITIGLGPAGMAVSVMGSAMGLKVCAIEKNKIGGECMNVGCIPSKSLLRMAKARAMFDKLANMELESMPKPGVKAPFKRIGGYIQFINDQKTRRMFDQVDLVLGQGSASFLDSHTVAVGDKQYTARKIFIATGTEPMVPPIPGIEGIDILTNLNIFNLEKIPESVTIIGGGAIGSEMAQALTRLGAKCTIVQMDPYLVPVGDPEAGALLEEVFRKEGITVHNQKKITRLVKESDGVALYTEDGIVVRSQRFLVAAGRRIVLEGLGLEQAGVVYGKRGIVVNSHLQTNQKHIFAVGDCNGHFLLTHAAMHQGMIALMNSMMPWPFKMKFQKFAVPWTVFTEPQNSHVGLREKDLKERGLRYEVVKVKYEDYGAAIAEDIGTGFLKAFISPTGRIYGVTIIGEGSGEMINEWALAIQKKARITDIMMLQHSFPTMGFLTK